MIKADGYFLITKKKWDETAVKLEKDLKKDEGMTHVSNMDLNDDGEQLILTDKNKDGLIIDVANGDGKWYRGDDSDPMQSMERNDSPGDGSDYSNWHNCEDPTSTALYWDSGRTEQGTPGFANLSENDPTANLLENNVMKVENVIADEIPKKENGKPGDLKKNILEEQLAATTDTPELVYSASSAAQKKVNVTIPGLSLSKKKWVKVRVNGKKISILKLRRSENDTILLLNLKYKKWAVEKYDMRLSYKNMEKRSVTNKKGKVVQKNVWIWKSAIAKELFSII